MAFAGLYGIRGFWPTKQGLPMFDSVFVISVLLFLIGSYSVVRGMSKNKRKR